MDAVFSGGSSGSSSAAGEGEGEGVAAGLRLAAFCSSSFSRASFSRAFAFAAASAASARLGSTVRSYSISFTPGWAVSASSFHTLPFSSLMRADTAPPSRDQ